MSKKFKLSTLVFTLVMALFFVSVNAQPLTSSDKDKPTAILYKYLDAAVKGSTDEMRANSIDTRLDTKSDTKVIDNWYASNLVKDSEKLVSYSLISKAKISPEEYKFITKLSFKDGSIVQVPFEVVKQNDLWTIKITPDSLDNSDFTVLEKSSQIDAISNALTSPLATDSHLDDWSFTGLSTTMYGTDSFNINSTAKKADICVSQVSQYYEPGLCEWQASIRYSVVIPHWYGDDVWGSTVVTGNYTIEATSATISGKSTTFSGAKIRLTRVDSYTGNLDDGDGWIQNG